ncbi:hypothetical protein AB0J21_10920 [Streptomyces sp. NPDC049954]|uniref:hypothetical protein n=1 Tax=Streptomyces sp. NPDC049954 TaxID=3155779 RepID=UPI00341DDBAE
MAKPGFGKRLAPGQTEALPGTFAHLPKREAAIAGFIDRLPVGAAIGYKALAAQISGYGQQACRRALEFLTDRGHLRRVKQHVTVEDGSRRWVTRTFFSRTARDAAWWREFVRSVKGIDLDAAASGAPETAGTAVPATGAEGARAAGPAGPAGPAEPAGLAGPAEPGAEAPGAPAPDVTDSDATAPGTHGTTDSDPTAGEPYRLLARVGRVEPRMALSHSECLALVPLAAEWIARGAGAVELTRVLTDRLPDPVHSPAAMARTRLENKMPPKPAPFRETVLEAFEICVGCEVPENVMPLTNGLCQECRLHLDHECDERCGGWRDDDEDEDGWEVLTHGTVVPDTFLSAPRGTTTQDTRIPDVAERVALLRQMAAIGRERG